MTLTFRQQQVLDHLEGHLLVLAGPGSGKTHTLIEKILHIFDRRVIPEPYGLLAITFSNAAVTEINKRLWDKSFRQWERVSVRTFHSFAMYLLRCYGSDLSIREDFDILDSKERARLLDELLRKHSSEMRRSEFDNHLQRFKRQGIYPDSCQRFTKPGEMRFRVAYRDFQCRLFKQNLLDFDDLMYFANALMRESSLAKNLFERYFRYIIVDEFQDTDHQQLQLLEIFAASAIGSTIFADDDQAIYGFRGGSKENVQNVIRILEPQLLTLEENFRSPVVVMEAAKTFIAKDYNRIEKKSSAKSDEKGALFKKEFLTDVMEATAIAGWITKLQDNGIVDDLGQIAVVSRNRKRAKAVLDALDDAGIPWFDRSRLSFESTWEVEIALSILGASCNLTSSESLYSLMAAIENSGVYYFLPERDALEYACIIRDKLQPFVALYGRNKSVAAILQASGLYEMISVVSASSSDVARRRSNLSELASSLEQEGRNRGIDLDAIVRLISGENGVQLVTSHGTKGREFEHVFFLGVEEDVIPGWRQLSNARIAEERRVFYVTITRTRKELYMTHAKKVGTYGNKKASRFLLDIPDEFFSDVANRWTSFA